MFLIRVSSLCGSGHLSRCKWLAKKLLAAEQTVVFVCDQDTSFIQSFFKEACIDFIALYPESERQLTINEKLDAALVQATIKSMDITSIIVDHYQLGKEWESQMSDAGYDVNAIDDLDRPHHCRQIFDSKLQDKPRYQSVERSTQLYLGPDYAMLAPEYITSSHQPFHKREQKILFSLGGGGDLSIISPVIEHLCQKQSLRDVSIHVVAGPTAQNTQLIAALSDQYKNLTLIQHARSLADHFSTSRLFVGALGTSLYEMSATLTPALTFSIARNQDNDIYDLEALGHYTHLDEPPVSASDFSNTIETLYLNADKLYELKVNAAIKVDGYGADRVASILLNKAFEDKKPKLPSIRPTFNAPVFSLKDIQIRPTQNKDINTYLDARNLESNKKRMTVDKDISRLTHYNWWFKNQRSSYVLEKSGEPALFIWHQTKQIDDEHYLFGGWFPAKSDISFDIALIALKWQLDTTHNDYPNHTWLAVIHKENKFVNLLNKYMGFKSSNDHATLIEHTKKIFPEATEHKFNFVHL